MKDVTTYSNADQINLKLMITLTRCLQSINRKEMALFQENNLTGSQFAVLEFLYHKGPSNIKIIINSILSSGGNLTVVIDNLEKNGLVERRHNEQDKRSRLICLTDKGNKLISEIFPRHIKNLKQILKHINEEDKVTLIRIAKQLGKANDII